MPQSLTKQYQITLTKDTRGRWPAETLWIFTPHSISNTHAQSDSIKHTIRANTQIKL